jgi:hypothetical protein
MSEDRASYGVEQGGGLSLQSLLQVLKRQGVERVFAKELSPNDNSKNQIYMGGMLTDISFVPLGSITPSKSDSKKSGVNKRSVKYQAAVDFRWIDDRANFHNAPHSKVIFYPQYPEVRFSGFVQGSTMELNGLMDPQRLGRSHGRWLVLGTSKFGHLYGYLASPRSKTALELRVSKFTEQEGAFSELLNMSSGEQSGENDLFTRLESIHLMGWIDGMRLTSAGECLPYNASNAAGYTLEALLDIRPNGYSQPDYKGWELKQFNVSKFPNFGAKPTTLLTPEPDGGRYVEFGVTEYVRQYGYEDRRGKFDRYNFGGKHTIGVQTAITGLTLSLSGFDQNTRKITEADGCIALIDGMGRVAASWSFAKLMEHWKRKHSKTCFLPCKKRVSPHGKTQFLFGGSVELGIGTKFELFLHGLVDRKVYYDPGIKLEGASSASPKVKRRSQFRVAHKNLESLFIKYDVQNLMD